MHANKRYTADVSGDPIIAVAATERVKVTNCRISSRGTDVGVCQVWISASSDTDTTFTSGEDIAIADDDYAPSATSKPGSKSGPLSIVGALGRPVRVTITGNLDCTVMLEYELSGRS